MMVGIMTYLFQVIVLAGDPKALLCIGYPGVLNILITKEYILKLVHPGIGEHQGGIVLDHHGGRGYQLVFLAAEKIQEFLSYFSGGLNHTLMIL
jgi:hypothetical protein